VSLPALSVVCEDSLANIDLTRETVNGRVLCCIANQPQMHNNSELAPQQTPATTVDLPNVGRVMRISAVVRRAAVLAVCVVVSVASPSATAEPDIEPSGAVTPGDGFVPSSPPVRVNTPDGWTLALGARDERQLPVPPLTTALSSREYLSNGIFVGSLKGPGPPQGVLEVGYEIGCGIDMSTANGVTIANGAGVAPSLGAQIPVGPPTAGNGAALLPLVTTPYNGVVSVGLKPGFVVVVPVARKEFKGANPWVMISDFHLKIDGCVGQSFVRSYASLTRETEESDVVLNYVGVTKAV
jgi:MspA